MSQDRTEITITVNRSTGKSVVTGDRLHIRDALVELTLVNVTQDDIDAGLVFSFPIGNTGNAYQRVESEDFSVDGSGNATCVFSTNTTGFVEKFENSGIHSSKMFSYEIGSEVSLVPISTGRIRIYNYVSSSGDTTTITPPSETLTALQASITALQATVKALESLQSSNNTALKNAISALDTAYQAADTAIAASIGAAVSAHNTSSTAHADIRDIIPLIGTAMYVPCDDDYYRKVISVSNSLSEQMIMLQQSPKYEYDAETRTYSEVE